MGLKKYQFMWWYDGEYENYRYKTIRCAKSTTAIRRMVKFLEAKQEKLEVKNTERVPCSTVDECQHCLEVDDLLKKGWTTNEHIVLDEEIHVTCEKGHTTSLYVSDVSLDKFIH